MTQPVSNRLDDDYRVKTPIPRCLLPIGDARNFGTFSFNFENLLMRWRRQQQQSLVIGLNVTHRLSTNDSQFCIFTAAEKT